MCLSFLMLLFTVFRLSTRACGIICRCSRTNGHMDEIMVSVGAHTGSISSRVSPLRRRLVRYGVEMFPGPAGNFLGVRVSSNRRGYYCSFALCSSSKRGLLGGGRVKGKGISLSLSACDANVCVLVLGCKRRIMRCGVIGRWGSAAVGGVCFIFVLVVYFVAGDGTRGARPG